MGLHEGISKIMDMIVKSIETDQDDKSGGPRWLNSWTNTWTNVKPVD